METIQVVLDEKLLHATDEAARRAKRNRSALIRDALREYLRKLAIRSKEESEREAYLRQPQTAEELSVWETEAVWPSE